MFHVRRLAALLAAGLLSIATFAGLSGATANASSSTANLSIRTIAGTSDCRLTVSGHAHLVQPAVTVLSLKVRGEDTWDDDELYDLPFRFSTDAAGNYVIQDRQRCSTYDEDWGEDDVYVKVSYFDPILKKGFEIRSNTIHRSF